MATPRMSNLHIMNGVDRFGEQDHFTQSGSRSHCMGELFPNQIMHGDNSGQVWRQPYGQSVCGPSEHILLPALVDRKAKQ